MVVSEKMDLKGMKELLIEQLLKQEKVIYTKEYKEDKYNRVVGISYCFDGSVELFRNFSLEGFSFENNLTYLNYFYETFSNGALHISFGLDEKEGKDVDDLNSFFFSDYLGVLNRGAMKLMEELNLSGVGFTFYYSPSKIVYIDLEESINPIELSLMCSAIDIPFIEGGEWRTRSLVFSIFSRKEFPLLLYPLMYLRVIDCLITDKDRKYTLDKSSLQLKLFDALRNLGFTDVRKIDELSGRELCRMVEGVRVLLNLFSDGYYG